MANGNGGGELEKLNTLFNTVVRAMRGSAGLGRATPAEVQALIQEEDPRFTTPQEIIERNKQIRLAEAAARKQQEDLAKKRRSAERI